MVTIRSHSLYEFERAQVKKDYQKLLTIEALVGSWSSLVQLVVIRSDFNKCVSSANQ